MRGGLLVALALLGAVGLSSQLTERPPITKGHTCGDTPGAVASDGPNSDAFNFRTAVSGTFLVSCSSCSLSGDVNNAATTLDCLNCANPDGSKSRASILVSTCTTRVFRNIGGRLECEKDLPQGDYQESCRDCTVTGTLLKCLCDGYPTGIRSSIVMGSCSRFSNRDGRLSCTPGFEDSE
mmetsp:Transcript_33145/g.81396  ORF Transcript_33145/g.81396 Transcript_33145/m.81396 type:complete len:180 (-) Transcript_33145:323-862(-)